MSAQDLGTASRRAADLGAALRRAETVLRRRPDMALHDDSPATAIWDGGTRIVASHANGMQVTTDMPTELGGTGDQVTPGWLLRAGLASCAATRIAMAAAAEGIELTALELHASSRSDTRGLFGMEETDGSAISAAPRDVRLTVRIRARGATPERLRALVEKSQLCAPVPCAMEEQVHVALQIDAGND
jgi:uncharacterized OsmC-like protein